MKKKLIGLMALISLLFTLSACNTATKSEKLQILCTGFAQYDWVRHILGERLDDTELILLANNNADLHSYQATVADLAKISNCDLFIYIGGTSDAWAEDALKNPRNQKRKVLALLEVATLLETEYTEEHDHDHNAYEEHVWLSLKYADKTIAAITELLAEADPDYAELYRNNAASYRTSIQELDNRYQQCVDTAKRRTLLFADRFPFRYLTEDYGLEYRAAFSGCSSETEASFSTIASLAKYIDEKQLTTVLVIESSDQVIAETVIENTTAKDQKLLIMDSIQAGSLNRVSNGETYLSIMENNLSVLQQALN